MERSKVSITRCESYSQNLVDKAVAEAVGALGGIRQFVKHGDKVLIKPNILSARKPEEAVCTHPAVLRAVIRLVKDTGAHITVGDSPGGFLKNIEEVYEISGINKVTQEEKVNLVKFTFSRTINGLPISTRVLDSDKIISVPKFKTHEITGITACVKNMYGSVVGLFKTKVHADHPKEEGLARILAQVYSITKPVLSIVDAVICMEGEGPSAGDPRDSKFIMAGCDGVACDTVLAHLIMTKPMGYAFLRECRKQGLGQTDIKQIDVLCGRIEDFYIKNIKHAQARIFLKFMPHFAANAVASQLKFSPHIEPDLCKKCNMCKSSCPVKAIFIKDDIFTVNLKKCIRCMCCREVCPYKAIGIRKNWLSRMIWE